MLTWDLFFTVAAGWIFAISREGARLGNNLGIYNVKKTWTFLKLYNSRYTFCVLAKSISKDAGENANITL